MIQDIYPHRLKNEYDPEKHPSSESRVMIFRGNEVLLRDDETLVEYPKIRDFPAFWQAGASDEEADGQVTAAAAEALQYLFSVDEEDFYLLKDGGGEESPVPGFAFRNAMTLRSMSLFPRHMIFAEFTGHQLARWYNDNRYCGTCGSPTAHSKTERAMVCTKCGRTIYPRILPAVIVAVKSADGERILMTKYADRPLAYYALVAGFTEIGETLEETVAREVMEEVGLRVKNIRYYKSQPWGVADDILMGFYCDVDGDETIHLDRSELKEGAWFTREEVVLQATDFSLTNEMMKEFREGRQ